MLEILIPIKQYQWCTTTWEPGVLRSPTSVVFRALPISYNSIFNTYSTWKPSGTASCSCRVGRLMNGTRHPGPEPYNHNRNHVSDKCSQRRCKLSWGGKRQVHIVFYECSSYYQAFQYRPSIP